MKYGANQYSEFLENVARKSYKMMVGFRVKEEKEIFKGRVFTLVNKKTVLPNGRETTFNIVEHPGAVAIVPMFENSDILLIKQFRLAAAGDIFEIPAGTLEDGESPLDCAKREVIEEVGYKAGKLTKLAEFFTAPGFCTEKMRLFLATKLSKATICHDKDECIIPKRVSLKKAVEMVWQGKIKDAKSIVGLCFVWRKLKGDGVLKNGRRN